MFAIGGSATFFPLLDPLWNQNVALAFNMAEFLEPLAERREVLRRWAIAVHKTDPRGLPRLLRVGGRDESRNSEHQHEDREIFIVIFFFLSPLPSVIRSPFRRAVGSTVER